MPFIPFSKKYPGEFLSRTEDNFGILLEKLKLFYENTRIDIENGEISRRKLSNRFDYEEELKDIQINQKGISTAEVALEFNDIISGCIRHQDPTTAFNIIPTPLLDTIAGITLASLYNANPCWDFISGKFCLYEKKIIRMLGNLVEWSNADGFVVTGGKQALAYAIKSGIGRVSNTNSGKMDEYVVICSVLAHYCVEHVCSYLGISPGNCLRIPTNLSGEIDLEALKKSMESAISNGKKIAAVIAVAGATINLIPDPILLIKKIIDQLTKDHSLNYTPYLHVDSVITWAWLSFEKNPPELSDCQSNPNVQRKIQAVLSKLSGIKYADSFAADFHKTGFCPYAAGVFIVKEPANLLGITSNGYSPPEKPRFGELEPLRQTFENSRSGLPIVSIWIAIRRMGLEGLREFILYQLGVSELIKKKILEKYYDHFEILNEHSNGWEIVIKPHFSQKLSWNHLQESSPEEQQNYIDNCYVFIDNCWYAPFEDENLKHPVIGFIPKYSRKGAHEKSLPALLIHPTSLHYDEKTIDEMIDKIFDLKIAFDLKHENAVSCAGKEYLYAVVPPR